ncbi:uncharacterized protein LOC124264610 [Haliotis rubra]|uniref:uncharacterized protein LOC124264610 n=1 Tax=Haliotis rubra TaxID=36100 RepID=UPI001EE4FEF8|nr:uncharacterized protein LOC124264610 [Haliotis rubra]XP_046555312.1 uncharacterized protein LOC124264610 [Haliotis rubra]
MMAPNSPIRCLTLLLFFLIHIPNGAPELICPRVGYLGSPATLTCIVPSDETSYGYTTSQGEAAAICNVWSSSCTTSGDYMASTINQTHNLLTIPAVQPAHAGEWRCHNSPCNLIVVKLPVCAMTHHVTDPDTAEGVSLGVNIKGYYCSELAQLKIYTGENVLEYPNETVTNITDKTVRINKTDAGIGTGLTFTCGDHRWNMSCILASREGQTHITSYGATSPPIQEDCGTRNAKVLLSGIGIGSGITILMFGICLGIAVIYRKRAIVLQVQASEVQQGIAVPVPEGEGYLTPRATSDNTSGTDELHLEQTQQNNYTELEGRRDGAFNQYEQMRIYHEI